MQVAFRGNFTTCRAPRRMKNGKSETGRNCVQETQENPGLSQRLLRRQASLVSHCERSGHARWTIRLPRPSRLQARHPQTVDYPHQRRRALERDFLLQAHQRPESSQHRPRPQSAVAVGHRKPRRLLESRRSRQNRFGCVESR